MKGYIAWYLFFVVLGDVRAQERFTQRIQQRSQLGARVVLYQSDAISNLVDGLVASRHDGESSDVPKSFLNLLLSPFKQEEIRTGQDSSKLSVNVQTGHQIRCNGFRIQVYAGGNNRESKQRAVQMESRVSLYYPELSTYTRFVSPRWVCHVGDFITREEAMAVLNDLRSKGGFNEAIIVKTKINAWIQ